VIQAVRGFKDIYGKDSAAWRKAENMLRKAFLTWGFEEIMLPVLEKTELFQRGIGGDTDIVEKEMYTFSDKGGEMVTLRPEGTASVIRLFNEHKLYGNDRFFKFFYMGPMFRYERPQKGRLRQFYQSGIEILGDGSPLAEGEALTLIAHIMESFGIKGFTIYLNSLGCSECRNVYKEKLSAFFEDKSEGLCEDCKRRRIRNPMRLLDCKSEQCRENLKNAPKITDFLCEPCARHFDELKKIIDSYNIRFEIAPFIVRGLDYYNRTVFEVHAEGMGAQSAILAGGRYDTLSASLGGHDIPAVGWAMGMERLISLISARLEAEEGADVFVAVIGDGVENQALPLIYNMRREGIRTEYDIFKGSLKSQFRKADKLKSKKVVIIGENELKSRSCTIKDMSTGEQKQVSMENIIGTIKGEL
jgi:histidyl-tRNA synthetase